MAERINQVSRKLKKSKSMKNVHMLQPEEGSASRNDDCEFVKNVGESKTGGERWEPYKVDDPIVADRGRPELYEQQEKDVGRSPKTRSKRKNRQRVMGKGGNDTKLAAKSLLDVRKDCPQSPHLSKKRLTCTRSLVDLSLDQTKSVSSSNFDEPVLLKDGASTVESSPTLWKRGLTMVKQQSKKSLLTPKSSSSTLSLCSAKSESDSTLKDIESKSEKLKLSENVGRKVKKMLSSWKKNVKRKNVVSVTQEDLFDDNIISVDDEPRFELPLDFSVQTKERLKPSGETGTSHSSRSESGYGSSLSGGTESVAEFENVFSPRLRTRRQSDPCISGVVHLPDKMAGLRQRRNSLYATPITETLPSIGESSVIHQISNISSGSHLVSTERPNKLTRTDSVITLKTKNDFAGQDPLTPRTAFDNFLSAREGKGDNPSRLDVTVVRERSKSDGLEAVKNAAGFAAMASKWKAAIGRSKSCDPTESGLAAKLVELKNQVLVKRRSKRILPVLPDMNQPPSVANR